MVDGGNAPVDRLVRHITGWLKALKPVPLVATGVALMLVATGAYAAINLVDLSDPRPSGNVDAASGEELGFNTLDGGLVASDLSDIPDSEQNFRYGTDPDKWNTAATPLPDAWLIRYGYDPLNPTVDKQPAARPPIDALPAKYDNVWPAKFVPTLWDVYSYDRPSDWNEETDGPFHNDIDPRNWDNSGDGIPDGWLLHYGLDPLDDGIGNDQLSGSGGLSVLEAFQYNTDPTKTDSDGDGLTDKEEIAGPANPLYPDVGEPKFPPTDPSLFSTAGTGVCDGYLVAHGLDPTDSKNSYRDLANSGATTLQKFEWSFARDPVGACASGAGLDPLAVSTTGGAIPDGWLLRYGLDPLDPTVPGQVTGSSADHPGPWDARTQPPTPDMPALPHVQLTVLDEYMFGRPTDWNEAEQGPWWGGTDPTTDDTDGDGLPDAVEMRGYYVSVALDLGPSAPLTHYHTTSHPGRSDTSGDGLNDYVVVTEYGTDPSKRDTDLDGIPDIQELNLNLGLDPLRADTAGDHLADGVRLQMLQSRAMQYRTDSTYEYRGEPGVAARDVLDWICTLNGVQEYIEANSMTGGGCPLSGEDLAHLFGPSGNLNGKVDSDGKPVPNVLDPDMDGDGLLNGWELFPSLYDHASPFPSSDGVPRRATDPMNPDTDGDQLLDGWEVRNGRPLLGFGTPRYSLEPSVWSTLCDPTLFGDTDCTPTSDAEQDLDQDGLVFTHFVENGGVVQAKTETIPFPALLEQTYQTDPMVASSSGDGLHDGWKHFWGIEYPKRLEQDPESLGIFRPLSTDGGPVLNVDQSGVVLASGPYAYFTLAVDAATVQERGETVIVYDDVPLRDGSATVHKVMGTAEFTMLDSQAERTNPYLAATGTAGHGVPDWWVWIQAQTASRFPAEGQCVSGPLSPLDPEAWNTDFDNDGLTTKEEFETQAVGGGPSTHPLCASTTLTGFSDGLMVEFEDPLDPLNAEDLRDQTIDSDGDGLFDYEERLGVWHEELQQFVKTDPYNPDTDGDGLLDGHDVTFPADEDSPWFRLYRDMGIPYVIEGNMYRFQGEMTHGGHPRNPVDRAGSGIPSGWLVAYERMDGPLSDEITHYEYGKPHWWVESIHGPWWGGNNPDLSLQPNPDVDLDGLLDFDSNGDPFEDPFPGANRGNQWPGVEWTKYPLDDLGLATPAESAGALNESQPDLVRRLIAQSYLDPRQFGDNSPWFSRIGLSEPDREQACLEFDQASGIRDENGQSTNQLRKGETSYMVGRFHDCSGVGIPDLTVDVRMNGETFGAGFTDDSGAFIVPFNITADQSVTIPTDSADYVMRGQMDGVVNWTTNPASVPPTVTSQDCDRDGDGKPDAGCQTVKNFMEISNYQTSSWSQATGGTFPVNVAAGSTLRLEVPDDIVTGRPFQVDFQILDSGGAPLQDEVVFTWDEKEYSAPIPDPSGRGKIELPAPDRLRGEQTLEAYSVSHSSFVETATVDTTIALRSPVLVSLGSVPEKVDPGQLIHLEGHVAFRNTGKAVDGNTPVNLNITRAGESIAGTTTHTAGSGGAFAATLQFPEELPRGQYVVIASTPQTANLTAAMITDTFEARSTPHFTNIDLSDLTQAGLAHIEGRIIDFDNTPLHGVEVQVALDGSQHTFITDGAGRFMGDVQQGLPGRPVTQIMTFGGSSSHTAVTQSSERTVLSPIDIDAPNGEVAFGSTVRFPLRLTDANDVPVHGVPIWVTWGTNAPTQILTDSNGVAQFERHTLLDNKTGVFSVHAEYRGGSGSGHIPATGTATWNVRSMATFDMPHGRIVAGAPVPDAVLKDQGTGQPLAKVPVTYEEHPNRGDGGVVKEVLTDADGRFPVLAGINGSSMTQIISIVAKFEGDEHYRSTFAESEIIVQNPVELQSDLPDLLVMGQETLVDVEVHTTTGRPVDEGVVQAILNGEVLAVAPVERGTARLNLIVPGSMQSGPSTMEFRFQGGFWHAPAELEEDVELRRPVRLTIETKGGLPGESTSLRVIATGVDGRLPFLPIRLEVEGIVGGLMATTDEDGVATFTIEQPLEKRTVAARFHGQGDLQAAQSTFSLAPDQPPSLVEHGVSIFTWVAAVASILLVLLGPIVYRLRMSPLEPVLRRTRRILQGAGDEVKKILLAYRHLEEAAIGQGFLDTTAKTPRLLQEAIEPRVPAGAHKPLDRLMQMFEMARYSEEEIGRDQCIVALDSLEQILGAMQEEAGFRWPQIRRRRAPA